MTILERPFGCASDQFKELSTRVQPPHMYIFLSTFVVLKSNFLESKDVNRPADNARNLEVREQESI